MQRLIIYTFLNVIILFGLIGGVAMADEDTKKIAVLPFDASNAGKYAQLKDGLKSMLSGRLATKDNLDIIDASLSEEEQRVIAGGEPASRQAIFTRLDLDYITMGRMIHSAEKLSLIMMLYSAETEVPLEVQVEAEGDHQILPAMDLLVLKMGDEIFGKGEETASTGTIAARKGIEAFRTEHPAKKYKEELISGSSVSTEGGVVIARGDLLRRRSAINGQIISMSVDDLDDDGIEEIFVVTQDDLRVYHYTKGLLEQLDAFEFPAALEVHAINLADMDNDGRSEIYLSAVANNRFSSLIMTWSVEEEFQVAHSSISYGIRPIQNLDGSWLLLGQVRNRTSKDFLKPGVYALEYDENKKFTLGKRMFLPDGVNLFDFVIADLDNDGFPEKVVIDRSLKLNVYNSNNDLIWQSEVEFGGSVNYLGSHFTDDSTPPSGYVGIGDERQDGIAGGWLNYLPSRLVARDGNNDGTVDIIAAKNELATFEFLKNLRSFKSGKVVCLSWNGTGMQEIWTTDALDGHVVDLYLTNEVTASSLAAPANSTDENGQSSYNTNKIRLLVGQDTGGGLENLLPFTESEDNLLIYEFAISSETTDSAGEE